MAKITIKDIDKKLTKEELLEIQNAEKKSRNNKDFIGMTPEKLKEFKRLHEKNAADSKQIVSLRVSIATLKIAKAYGKGYTAFLSRLLDEAIQNEELVKKCI